MDGLRSYWCLLHQHGSFPFSCAKYLASELLWLFVLQQHQMVTITIRSGLTEISPCHVSRHFPSQPLPRSFQRLFVWDEVLQGWAHAQIKKITLLLSSPLGKAYFKIHLGSLVWNWISFAGPSCVCLVPVTVMLDGQEPAAILEGAMATSQRWESSRASPTGVVFCS